MSEPYDIPSADDALLAECVVNTFRGTGHGGQSVNTADSAVRLRHVPSSIVVVARRERSQYLNKQAALARLRERLEAENARIAAGGAPRKPQQRSRAVRERVLADKRARATVKRSRERVDPGEE
ncbi:MAG: peptide chain release factor-like protein [Actinobacteria bacterium]|nr:peptide chain release factor-like protein [Actinomycetota bacterium]